MTNDLIIIIERSISQNLFLIIACLLIVLLSLCNPFSTGFLSSMPSSYHSAPHIAPNVKFRPAIFLIISFTFVFLLIQYAILWSLQYRKSYFHHFPLNLPLEYLQFTDYLFRKRPCF